MNSKNNLITITVFLMGLLMTFACTKDDNDAISPADVEKWTYFSAGYGLPSNKVYCLAEDGFNNIWIGTDKGLVKYDGNGFTTYSTKTGLPSDKIYSLLWDSGSELLIGTQYGFGKMTSTGKYSNIFAIPYLSVFKFSENKKVNLIYCATDWGLLAYDRTDNSLGYEVIDSTLINGTYEDNPIYDIVCDNHNYTWMATPLGAYCFTYPGKKFFSNTNLGISDDYGITSLFSDKTGNVWIGPTQEEKVIYYQGSKFVNDTIFFGYNNYKAFAQDQYYNYWISIEGHGIMNYGGGMSKVYNTSNSKIVSNNINCILYDSKGNIWLGSNDRGLMYYQNIKPLQFEFDSGKNSETNPNPIN